jgi:prepilin signal peptidase PulO-like enzyme (type II secretory pathway)
MVIYMAFSLFSLVISILDVRTGSVSRFLLWGGMLSFFFLKFLMPGKMVESAVGGVLGIAIFLLAFFISKKRLGLADVWYAGLIGIVLGPVRWYPAILLSCLLGIGAALISRRRTIPFIPCMAVGSYVILSIDFWGR